MAIDRAGRAGSPARAPAGPGAGAGAGGGTDPPEEQVRIIQLNDGEHQDSTLYRFDRGTLLQFSPGPSLLGRQVFLYTNYPVDNPEEAAFVRNQYYQLEWRGGGGGGETSAGSLVTSTDLRCELRVRRAGSFHYYFVYEHTGTGPMGSGWWHGEPTLPLPLPLDGLSVQTVITRCLGPLARWEQALQPARDAAYTAVHFTPVQCLGASDSAYSLSDQMRLDPRIEASVGDLEQFLCKMRHEWKMLSLCDVVLNHTANESPWLREHPDSAYTCVNTPRLRAAALLDALLHRLSTDVAAGGLTHVGVPPTVEHDEHLDALRQVLWQQVPTLRLHELYQLDAGALLNDFMRLARRKLPPVASTGSVTSTGSAASTGEEEPSELKLIQDPQYRRLHSKVDLELALRLYNVYLPDTFDEETRLQRCAARLKQRLDQLNQQARDDLDEHTRAAIDNCIAGIRYWRVQSDGPRLGAVTADAPLVPRYFTWPAGCEGGEEGVVFGAGGRLVMAHNGWVMRADPLKDFALEGHVYLRRELIAWGDSVKLRYGSCPDDSPWLWSHMRGYVEQCAELFDGVRLDNCHSTPLHVAEHMLDAARNVKPQLYVLAELFTDSPLVDNIFVNRLGITSLVREAQSAWDARELGRQLHRFGGRSVGAFPPALCRSAPPAQPRALLCDVTHDNPSPIDTRCVLDLLPTAALAAMVAAPTGSTRGYDELVPHAVHVVEEKRLYPAPGHCGVSETAALIPAKRLLNTLHAQLARDMYTELYVDQMDDHVIAVTRHCPRTRESVILVAHTAFSTPSLSDMSRRPPPLRFEGRPLELSLEAWLQPVAGAPPYQPHPRYINGLGALHTCVWTPAGTPLKDSRCLGQLHTPGDGVHTVIEWAHFPPGAVVAIRVAPPARCAGALPAAARPAPLAPLLRALDLLDLNVLLYRSGAEEKEMDSGLYDVPGHGELVYGGLQGVMSVLEPIALSDDLAHPLCAHLRDGDWLLDYTWQRLAKYPRLRPVADYYKELMRPIKELPRYLVPAYYWLAVSQAHGALQDACIARMSPFVQRGGVFTRALALTSVQLVGHVPSASLPAPSPALPPPPLPGGTLAAGLPHFATGYMRSWGRDTFIALRGLLLLTGRYQEARAHILGYAACLRHGLIPNLLDGGARARYNCRDALWWWLHAIQSYCELVPQGERLLHDPVRRLFATDDAPPALDTLDTHQAKEQPLHQVMQEALDTHFQGLVFRERNAGRDIDAHMSDAGFTLQVGLDPETGFPFGGNEHNCGTWMDKMGSSSAAGTRGRPATPRDGTAVELAALAHSTALWLARGHAAGHYPHPGLTRRAAPTTPHTPATPAATAWSWRQWAERMHASFERTFWVGPPGGTEARPDLVHRRNIYKDCAGASQPWADYQLRCNYSVALCVSPSLADPSHARAALHTADLLLRGPLGMKTLDPQDWAYCGDYDNDDHGNDPKTAHGFNYHQGPEWVWPLGFHLRARLLLAPLPPAPAPAAPARAAVRQALGRLQEELLGSVWRALPELTNANGAPCRHSCASQAWSSSVMLEVLYELEQQERAVSLPGSD